MLKVATFTQSLAYLLYLSCDSASALKAKLCFGLERMVAVFTTTLIKLVKFSRLLHWLLPSGAWVYDRKFAEAPITTRMIGDQFAM
jgi:hypothetical protein